MACAWLRAGLVAAALSLCGTALAADARSPFASPVALRGTLGDAQVQVNLRPKADIDEGIEGDYFIFGGSPKILLAGEIEGDDVFLEESENGTDVSGQWEGKWTAEGLTGNWRSADGAVNKPFALKLIRTVQQPARAKP